MINYGGHKLFGTAESEVTKVLQSDFLTQGPVVARFESKVDHFLHGLSCRSSRASVCVSSGSAALVGLLQCNAAFSSTAVTQSSVFLVPVNTYIATANAVLAAGYSIEYVDCDPLTGNVTAGTVELAVQRVLGGGRVVSGAIVTHIGGQAVDITEVRRRLPEGRRKVAGRSVEGRRKAGGRPAEGR